MRIAVVTGASSGIGKAASLRLARDGFTLLAVGRDRGALEALCDEIRRHGAGAADTGDSGGRTGGAHDARDQGREPRAPGAGAHDRRAEPFAADVTAADAPVAIVNEALRRFGRIDALVNAAGIIASGAVADTTDAGWDQMLDVNVRAPFRLIREAAAALADSRGSVVNISSVAGLRAFPGLAAYCVSKAAVDQLTRVAALDLAPKGVRVNAVNPGVVVTNLHRRGGMDEAKYADFLERSKATHPLGRPGTPDEIADLIAFLVSPAAAWITGETISIDGGRHLTCLR